jgi:hypothetical protein
MSLGVNLILGSGLVIYGLYMFILRRVAAQKISKLQALIESHAEKTGYKIHLIGHTALPLVAGILLIIAHFRG